MSTSTVNHLPAAILGRTGNVQGGSDFLQTINGLRPQGDGFLAGRAPVTQHASVEDWSLITRERPLALKNGPSDGGAADVPSDVPTTSVHASVVCAGHDKVEVEAWDAATNSWVKIGSKDLQGPFRSAPDIATIRAPDDGSGWGVGAIKLRVRNLTTGGIIDMDAWGARVTENPDGTVTVAFEDRPDEPAASSYDDVVVTLQPDTRRIDDRSGAGVQTMPPLPISEEDVFSVTHPTSSHLFFERLAAFEEGSDERTLYNLLNALQLASSPDFEGKVDILALKQDIHDYMQKPNILALMAGAQADATQEVLGITPQEAASKLRDALLSPETVTALRQLTPAVREKYIDSALHRLAFFDPQMAKDAHMALPRRLLTEGTVSEQVDSASPEAQEAATQVLFQLFINAPRFPILAGKVVTPALKKIIEEKFDEAQAVFADYVRTHGWPTGETDLATIDARLANLDISGLGFKGRVVIRNLLHSLSENGALGSLGGVFAAVAVVQDFAGVGTMNTDTPWGIVNTTADVMSVIANAPEFAKTLNALGLSRSARDSLGADAAADGAGEAAADAAEGAAADVEAGAAADAAEGAAADVEAGAAADAAGGAAADVEAGAAADAAGGAAADAAEGLAAGAEGLSNAMALEMASEVSPEVAAEVSAFASLSSGFGRIFSNLGVLGNAALILYGAKSIGESVTEFSEGDTVGGIINVGLGLSLAGAGAAGLAGFIGAAAGFAFASGPFLPLVSGGLLVAGFALTLGNFFHDKHKHHEVEVDEGRKLFQSGIGTGKNYYLPDRADSSATEASAEDSRPLWDPLSFHPPLWQPGFV